MPATIRNLTERRVPQYVAIYLGASWGLVQFVDFITSHYGLSPHWTDLALLTLGLLLPSVVLYTYHHGRPGRDAWQKSEKLFIPANVLLLVIVLFSIASTTNLSALTTRVKLKDEKGNTVERVVVNKAYRKRVAMFSFDTEPGTAKWLGMGAPVLTGLHLQQQQFIQAVPSVEMRTRLAEAGYKDGLNVPLTLKRQLADERHVPNFLSGTIEQTAHGITAKVQLYETATARLIAERSYTEATIAGVADMISEHLVKDLDVPALGDAKPLLSVAEITSQKPEALRACLEALDALAWRNDYATAKARLADAVRIDPTSAYAYLMQYSVATMSGSKSEATQAIQGALDHAYRLPERLQQFVKVGYYESRQDYPRAFAILDMLSQLYPEDVQVLEQKAEVSEVRDDRPAEIATLRKILELDPTRAELLLKLGGVYETTGDAVRALGQYQVYAKKYPTEHRPFKLMGDLYIRTGEHGKARASYEQALLLKPQDVSTLVMFADLEAHNGDFAAAQEKLEQALAAARTAEDRATALQGMASLQDFTGQIQQSLVTIQQSLVQAAQFMPPAQLIWQQFLIAARSAKQDPIKAQAQLVPLKQKLGPVFAMFSPIADLDIYWELRDAAKEEASAVALDATIQKTSFAALKSIALQGHARAQELTGNYAAAIDWYRQQLKNQPLDARIQRDIGRCYRKLGNVTEAKKALNAVLKIVPADGEANLELALLYKQAGDSTRARQFAAIALKTWQNADAGYRPAQQARQLL